MTGTIYQYSSAVGEQYGQYGQPLPSTGGPDLGLLILAVLAIVFGALLAGIVRRRARG